MREQILDVAETRFRHYGYRKTTMVEIAQDVEMSAANLYRYFTNKQDIAAACVNRCFGSMETLLREVIGNSELSTAQKLEQFILTMLRYTHEQTAQHNRINEIVELIATKRQDLVLRKNEGLRILIAEILREGNQKQEFNIRDTDRTAEVVLTTTVQFMVPIFMNLYPLQEFERMASDVAQLLVHGLASR